MAKLHRLVKSEDRLNSHVFTFIVPASIGSENARDIISSEFMCGNQKWNISLVKQDKHLGAFVTLKNPSPGLFVTVDYGFTVVNRGHYTANESFNETGAVFTKQKPTQGRKAFISVSDLKSTTRGFLQEKDQIFIEVTVCNFKTIFEYQLQLPMTDKERSRYPPGDMKMETGFFPFGGSEWNVNLKITEKNPHDVRGGSSVTLRRLSNFDHYCKFKYRIHVGVIEPTPLPGQPIPPKPVVQPHHHPGLQQNKVISSNPMDSLFIDADTQDKLVLPTNIYKLATLKGVITLKIECLQSTTLTLLQIPMDRNRHRALRCYDRDKQAWLFEAHMKSDRLKFYLFYGDIATVPRGCIRMMNVGVSVLPAYGNVKLVKALRSPYMKYYNQQPQDDFGLEVMTDITMKEIIDTKSIYVYDTTNSLTVQIEWGDSYLLKETNYQMSDDIPRFQKMQMEREIRMLQKENLILEKQVHSYQTTIAQKDSKGEFDPNQAARAQFNPNAQMDQYGNPVAPYPGGQNSLHPGQQALPGSVNADPRNMMASGMTQGAYSQGPMNNASTVAMNSPYSQQPSVNRASDMPPRNDVMNNQYGRSENGPGGRYNDMMGRDGHTIGRGDYHGLTESRSSDMSRGMDHMHARDGILPVPAERGQRSRSADPSASQFSPMPERRPKRNSTTGVEYADHLERNGGGRPRRGHPDDRHRGGYDGYRSDSGYRSDTMQSKSNDMRYQQDHYNKDGRPRPSSRSKNSDSRSDFGDYNSERRSKTSYDRDRDMDAYSDRGNNERGYSDRKDRSMGGNILKSNKPSGRSSYAGHDGEYPGLDYGHPKSHGRTSVSSRPTGTSSNHREQHRPRMMENGD